MTKTYKTFIEPVDYIIVTERRGPRDFMAAIARSPMHSATGLPPSQEFMAFGTTEPRALTALSALLLAAAGSISKLAMQRENEIYEDGQA